MKNLNTSRDLKIFRQRLRNWLLVGLAWICLTNAAHALDPDKNISQYIRDRWGSDQGFLGGSIYALGQSADGFLWIGTERGLVRFDGFHFILLQRPIDGAPPIGSVRHIVLDEKGNLWIRPDNSPLLLYRDGRFEDPFAHFDFEDDTITAMSLDHAGQLLVSGTGRQTLRYRNGRFETIADAREAPGTVLSMAETPDRTIWMGTRDNGLFRIDGGHVSGASAELAGAEISVLFAGERGGLWVGTDRGLLFWDGTRLTKPGLPSAINQLQILAMNRDREGNLWVGTNHGLIRITSAGDVSLSLVNRDPNNDVTAICEDSDGDIWFGGSRGLERLREGMFTTFSTAEGLPSENSGPVYVDPEGRTWFAPVSGGLRWFKDGHVVRVNVGGLDHDVVYSISGNKDEVWVGRQRGGLTLLTSRGGSFIARTFTQADGLAQNSVYSVHCNRDGTVWAGTVSGGLSRLKDGVFTNYSEGNGLASNSINSIVEGADGEMWFATPNGLELFADGRWRNRSVRDGLPSANVRTIFEDSQQVLWIATSGGLAYLSGGKLEVPRNLQDPLREQIFGIAEGKRGFLWIATSDHVLQVNRSRLMAGLLDEVDVRSYGTTDGLQGVEAVRRDRSMVADSFGRVWVSLNQGLAVANPKLGISNAVPVQVRIESMSVDGSQMNLQSYPKVVAGSQSITFNYVGPSLSAPERVRFRYKLDGSDRDWSGVVGLRQVAYTHLGPGSYRFRVVASNGEGLWNGPETTLPFVVEPSFWQTWWFRASFLAMFLLAIVAIYRLRMYQLTNQLNVRFQERLAERTRIAQELHDTLLQGVLSASMQLDVAEDQLPDGSPTKPLLKRVLQLMSHVSEEGRNALRGLRTAEGDDRDLELAFSRMRQEFAIDEEMGYRVIAQNNTRPLRPLIRDEVYRIGREAILNAFVHARANSIEVEVEYANGYLRVLVRDDGCGINPQVLESGRKGHWGLIGMRERSESIGATLILRSRIGTGTEVELTVPGMIAFETQSRVAMSRWLSWLNREKFEARTKNKKREHS